MKATLTFDLTSPEDKEAHLRAIKATDAYLAMWTFAQEILRRYRKYDVPENLKDPNDLIVHIEEQFYRILEEHNINLYEELS